MSVVHALLMHTADSEVVDGVARVGIMDDPLVVKLSSFSSRKCYQIVIFTLSLASAQTRFTSHAYVCM